MCGFRDWLWDLVVEDHVRDAPHLRVFFAILDTFVSAAAGIVEDGVLEHGWEAVNRYELCEWLARHGAKQVTLGATPAERSPILRSIYDVAFGYPDGDIAKANVAAGTAMNDFLRLNFTYRGSLMYKMQAGMGDTVLAPFYLGLEKRGVKFDFFSAVTGLGLDKRGRRVETIELVRQVELSGPATYRPLIDVRGLECWPSEPLWDQVRDGEELSRQGHDFEHEANPLGRPAESLQRGRDFDQVVLAIPVGALGEICRELADRLPRFAEMLDNSATVCTQSFQLWLARPPTELGYQHSQNSIAGSYVEPLDTWCDMTHLLAREQWSPAEGVAGIAYFCGVLGEAPLETPVDATRRVKGNAEAFLEGQIAPIMSDARGPGGRGFDWQLLAGGGRSLSGPARMGSQYWRADVTPSERYVLTPAGSVAHRLAADESGLQNMVLAGDWTRNGIDGGCVEAAVTSGLQAARALIGDERPLSGEQTTWLAERRTGPLSRAPVADYGGPAPPSPPRPAGRPEGAAGQYVEYGGRATAPPPFRSTGGRFQCLALEGDASRITALIDRMLNVPAAGRVHYRPLFGKHLLLQTGAFASVSSQAPEFDRWGYVEEAQISLWVPLAAGRLEGSAFIAERLCLAVPYILVNNPMSYAGGREDYGYPKTLGIFSPADGLGDPLSVEAFGGQFDPADQAGWHPLFRISRGAGPRARKGGGWHDLKEAGRHITELGEERLRELSGIPAPSLIGDFLAALEGRQVRQVFLKQFRDVRADTAAIYQSVVEAPIHFLSTSLRPSLEQWSVQITPLDSHPIGPELGLSSQTTRLSFDVKMDMIAEPGIVVAP